jgi:hypothetical protein
MRFLYTAGPLTVWPAKVMRQAAPEARQIKMLRGKKVASPLPQRKYGPLKKSSKWRIFFGPFLSFQLSFDYNYTQYTRMRGTRTLPIPNKVRVWTCIGSEVGSVFGRFWFQNRSVF